MISLYIQLFKGDLLSPARLWRCPIATALSEKLRSASFLINAVAAGVIHRQHQRRFSSVVFWDALTNIGVCIDSLHLSRGHCG